MEEVVPWRRFVSQSHFIHQRQIKLCSQKKVYGDPLTLLLLIFYGYYNVESTFTSK